MASCIHCGRSKGKRTCPALGGEICAPCCGKHRVVDIACPADCKWLGGLAAVRDVGAVTFTDIDEHGAVARLIQFTESGRELTQSRAGFRSMLGLHHDPGPDAMRAIMEELGPTSSAVLTAHLAFGHRADDGTRAVDRLLSAHGRDCSRGEVAALMALQRARGLLVEVTAAQRGLGMVLRDRLSGDVLTIVTQPSEAATVGTTAYVWLVENGGKLEATGPMVVVPREQIAAVEARLTAAIAGAADPRAVLAAAAPLVLAVLREAPAEPAAVTAPSA